MSTDTDATGPEPLTDERAKRIAELEAKAARRRPLGIRAPTALVAIVGGVVLLSMQARDLAYFFSSEEPITLGTEGDYHFDRIVPNRFAQLHGAPTARGIYAKKGSHSYVAVGVRDTPIIVWRAALPDEEWEVGHAPPQPHQAPFGVRGRLLPEAWAGPYHQAFDELRNTGELSARDGKLWLLMKGEKPRGDLGELLLCVALVAFVLANAFFLARDLAFRARGR